MLKTEISFSLQSTVYISNLSPTHFFRSLTSCRGTVNAALYQTGARTDCLWQCTTEADNFQPERSKRCQTARRCDFGVTELWVLVKYRQQRKSVGTCDGKTDLPCKDRKKWNKNDWSIKRSY